MIMALGIITGIRHGATLASLFMLIWVTMGCGFLTELYSRPLKKLDGTYDFSRWQGDPADPSDPSQPAVSSADTLRITFENRASTGSTGSAAMRDHVFPKKRTRFSNYCVRMIPHVFGFFPYITAWYIILDNFWRALNDLKREDEALFDRIPWFVPIAVSGTFVLFSTFTFTQIIFQWQPPRYYWKTEAWYSLLSLTSKLMLGGLLYSNVLRMSSFDEALEVD